MRVDYLRTLSPQSLLQFLIFVVCLSYDHHNLFRRQLAALREMEAFYKLFLLFERAKLHMRQSTLDARYVLKSNLVQAFIVSVRRRQQTPLSSV